MKSGTRFYVARSRRKTVHRVERGFAYIWSYCGQVGIPDDLAVVVRSNVESGPDCKTCNRIWEARHRVRNRLDENGPVGIDAIARDATNRIKVLEEHIKTLEIEADAQNLLVDTLKKEICLLEKDKDELHSEINPLLAKIKELEGWHSANRRAEHDLIAELSEDLRSQMRGTILVAEMASKLIARLEEDQNVPNRTTS